MIEIKEKQELNVTNLLSFRGKVSQTELESVRNSMQEKILSMGAKQVGGTITATYAMEGDIVDVEILMPINTIIEDVEEYVFKESIHIENAVVVTYKGHPSGAQEAINKLNQYVISNKLRPITVGYGWVKKMDLLNLENTEIEMYVGVED